MQDPEMYVVLDSRLDAFGGASNPAPFTIAMFVYAEEYSAYLAWQFGTVSTSSRWSWGVNCEMKFEFVVTRKKMYFTYCIPGQTAGRTDIESPELYEFGKWQHLAMTYDQTKVRFYLNGVMRAEQSYTITLTTYEVYAPILYIIKQD